MDLGAGMGSERSGIEAVKRIIRRMSWSGSGCEVWMLEDVIAEVRRRSGGCGWGRLGEQVRSDGL